MSTLREILDRFFPEHAEDAVEEAAEEIETLMMESLGGSIEPYCNHDPAAVDANGRCECQALIGLEYGPETIVPLQNGYFLHAESADANPEGTTYIRFVDRAGGEVVSWSSDEWQADPIGVMGAIVGCLRNGARLNREN